LRGRRRYRPGGLSVAAHDEFAALDEFRAALLMHCYRMLGAAEAAEPAEDVVQETCLRALLDRFAAAFEDGDVVGLAASLREDVTLEMPPLATWFSGREAVLGYVASNLRPAAGRIRLVPVAANGQPAYAAYLRDAGGAYRAHAIIVLTLTGALITRIVIFVEPALFRLFGLDRELAPGESGDHGCSTSPVGPAEVATAEQAEGDGGVSRGAGAATLSAAAQASRSPRRWSTSGSPLRRWSGRRRHSPWSWRRTSRRTVSGPWPPWSAPSACRWST
jgi:ketosteroid isomerase-like protein